MRPVLTIYEVFMPTKRWRTINGVTVDPDGKGWRRENRLLYEKPRSITQHLQYHGSFEEALKAFDAYWVHEVARLRRIADQTEGSWIGARKEIVKTYKPSAMDNEMDRFLGEGWGEINAS